MCSVDSPVLWAAISFNVLYLPPIPQITFHLHVGLGNAPIMEYSTFHARLPDPEFVSGTGDRARDVWWATPLAKGVARQ